MSLHNPHEKYQIFKSQREQSAGKKEEILHSSNKRYFWSDRLVLVEDKDKNKSNKKFHYFIGFDLLMNESRSIRFRKPHGGHFSFRIYPLDGEFGFIVKQNYHSPQHIYLVKLNWETNELQFVEYSMGLCRKISVIVDKSNPSKFLYKWTDDEHTFNYQVQKLVNGEMEFVEFYESDTEFYAYSNDKLIQRFGGYLTTQLKICDLESKEEYVLDIDRSFLRECDFLVREDKWTNFCHEWIDDSFYTRIQMLNTKKYGIAHADLTTKRLTFVDFQTSLKIKKLKFLNGNLIVETENRSCFNGDEFVGRKIYSIPIRRPHFLRQSAWLLVVKVMEQRNEEDPYGAAKEFLPLTSDLREQWFKDTGENGQLKSDLLEDWFNENEEVSKKKPKKSSKIGKIFKRLTKNVFSVKKSKE